MEETRNAYKSLVGNPEILEDGRIILEWILGK
jgi:hypothetical protein